MERLDLAAALIGATGIAWVTHRLSEERKLRIEAESRARALEYAALVAKDTAAADDVRAVAAQHRTKALLSNAAIPGPTRPGPSRRAPAAARTYDRLFAEHAQGIPIAYLRALAYGESRLDPKADNGHAVGLLQIVQVVRLDYNKRHGTAYTREDLFDPTVNVIIGAHALRTIIRSYRRYGTIRNLREDWDNYRFVELLTAGWNGGWSDKAGVGLVARYLAARGITEVTVERIHQYASAAGATRHLSNPQRLAWAKGVARHYVEERARDYAREVAADGPLAARIGTTTIPSEPAPIEMPPEIVERRPPVSVRPPVDASPVSSPSQVDLSPAPVDASPVSSPSQVDPSPVHVVAAAPPEATLLDPYPEAATSSPAATRAAAVASEAAATALALLDPYPDATTSAPSTSPTVVVVAPR